MWTQHPPVLRKKTRKEKLPGLSVADVATPQGVTRLVNICQGKLSLTPMMGKASLARTIVMRNAKVKAQCK